MHLIIGQGINFVKNCRLESFGNFEKKKNAMIASPGAYIN